MNSFLHSPTSNPGRKIKNNPTKQKPPDQSNSYVGLSLHDLWHKRKPHLWVQKSLQITIHALELPSVPKYLLLGSNWRSFHPFSYIIIEIPRSFLRKPFKIEFVSTCRQWRINTQLPKLPRATSKEQMLQDIETHDECIPSQHTDRKRGRIMRAREKREESHTDYKGIPILVVKKRGQRCDNVTKHTMKLLSPNYLACTQGTEELGSVGTGWGGGRARGCLWKESEIG